MVKEIFRKERQKDSKPMYDKIKMLVKAQKKANYVKPGESHIISNEQ